MFAQSGPHTAQPHKRVRYYLGAISSAFWCSRTRTKGFDVAVGMLAMPAWAGGGAVQSDPHTRDIYKVGAVGSTQRGSLLLRCSPNQAPGCFTSLAQCKDVLYYSGAFGSRTEGFFTIVVQPEPHTRVFTSLAKSDSLKWILYSFGAV